MLDKESTALVEIAALRHAYREGRSSREVLHDINLRIEPSSIVFLTGYSGSGKTTLLSLVGCLRSVQHGSLKLFGEELNGAGSRKLLAMRRKIGYIFQSFNLLDFMTIRQNVMQTLELQDDFEPQAARRRCEEILDKVGLGDRAKDYPRDLSGGQKQRVAIARALAHNPRLVLADEPTAALDAATGREIIDLFGRLAKEQGSAVFLVTHNMRILDAADEILHLDDGRLGTAVAAQISLIFPTLSESQLSEVSAHAEQRIYKPGEVVFRQGDEASEFFILLNGAVEIVCEDLNGKTCLIDRLSRRGDYFGEIELMSGQSRRLATIEVSEDGDARVLAIGRTAFIAMIEGSRPTRAIVNDILNERLAALNRAHCDRLEQFGEESPQRQSIRQIVSGFS